MRLPWKHAESHKNLVKYWFTLSHFAMDDPALLKKRALLG